MTEVLKGSVGLQGKDRPKVSNDLDDVELVRRMLRANGYKVPPTGPVGPDVYKALKAAALKAGIEQDFAVIEPNSPLSKALKAKYEQAKKKGDDGKGAGSGGAAKGAGGQKMVDVYKVSYKGSKPLIVTKADFDAVNAKVFASLSRYVSSLISASEQNQDTINHYAAVAMGKNGALEAFTQIFATSMRISPVRGPNEALATAAYNACKKLKKTFDAKDIKNLRGDLASAEVAVNSSIADVQRFLKEFTGAAGQAAVGLAVVSAAGFAVMGALGASVLVVGGMTEAAALAASAAATKVLETAATDLGRVASGEKVTILEAITNATINGIIAAFTSGLGSKLTAKFSDKLTQSVAGSIAKKFAMEPAKVVPFVKSMGVTPGIEAIKSGTDEALTLLKDSMQKGKLPSKDDIVGSVMKVIAASLTAGIATKLSRFNKVWAMKNRGALEGQIFPDALKSVMNGKNVLPSVIKAKIWAEVLGKVEEQALQTGIKEALGSAGAEPDEAKMAADAEKGLLADTRIRKLVEAEMKKALKKHKIEAG